MVTTISATIAVLCERFPRCFVQYERRRKPLKIGIHTDLLQALEGAVAPLELGRALQAYVSNPFYLRACVNGAWHTTSPVPTWVRSTRGKQRAPRRNWLGSRRSKRCARRGRRSRRPPL
jgi:hypothetical protein